ncbi:methyltransferase [Nocardiopsis synnemataformans]|uniref:methyltransferase n=1 Tax=Nocardiopsis synnemataformans TaxID=61305 RepID=UPI003EC03FE4
MEETAACAERTDLPLARLVSSAMLMHAASALVELEVVEELAEGPRPVADLARCADVREEGLTSVLRAGASAGLVAEPEPGVFALTAAGQHLRTGVPGSLRDLFRMCTYGDFLQAWTCLPQAVRSGRTAFEVHTGRPLFAYLEEEREAASLFTRAMNTSVAVDALLENVDLSGAERVADLGGGEGALLAAVLRRHPHLEGTLFDLPHVVDQAGPLLRERGVADRCSVVGGSFLDKVPTGADVYLMARVMQNWPREEAVRILRNVSEAMEGSARLLIVGHLPERESATPFLQAMSLYMLVLYGAPLRTAEEYQGLFSEAGLALHAVHRVEDEVSVMDVRRA